MKRLATDFNRNGFHHHQIARDGNIAIYRRERIGGKAEHYEVVRIVMRPATEIAGKAIGEREAYPPSEDWGVRGWTFLDSEGAWDKFRQLVRASEAGLSQTGHGGHSGAIAGLLIIPCVDAIDDHTW